MDTGLVSAVMGAKVGQLQLAVAARMMKMNADADRSVVQLVDSAQKNFNSLANVASGIGGNLDISV
jgi:hypothetical protein